MRILIIRAGVLACLFLQGLLIGWLSLLLAAHSDEPPEQPPSIIDLATPVNTLAHFTPQQNRQQGEKLLLSGDPYGALPHLLNATPDRLENADRPLLFRIALCYESAGDYPRAGQIYRKAATTSDKKLRLASEIGLARCQIQLRQWSDARPFLWTANLLSDGEQLGPFASDVRYLLIQAYATLPSQEDRELLLTTRSMACPSPQVRADLILKKLTSFQNADPAADGLPPDVPVQDQRADIDHVMIDNVIHSGDGQNSVFCNVKSERAKVGLILGWVSEKLDVPIQLTEEATTLVDVRRADIDLKGVDLATLLDALTLPFDLCWQTIDGQIMVLSKSQASPSLIQQADDNAVLRLLQRVLIVDPDHRHANIARTNLASLNLANGRVKEASLEYEELLVRPIDSVLRQCINFNLGQIHLSLNQMDLAIGTFERVVESNEVGRIQTIAYLKLGRIHLERREMKEAITAYSRAFQLAESSYLRQVALIGQASSYVLDNNGRLANRLLRQRRTILSNYRLRNFADLLIHLPRIASDGSKAENHLLPTSISSPDHDRVNLLTAVANAEYLPELGAQSHMFMAHAFRQLGLSTESRDQLQLALEITAASQLRAAIIGQLASELIADGDLSGARQILLTTIHDPEMPAAGDLSMRLAELELSAENFDTCLQICREVLADADLSSHYPQALSLMGSVYQQQGLHHRAALCFAGLLPHSSE